ncbi:MAG: hypothetical protein AAFV25_26155, partial [Bacteroidota bacterium]
TTKHFFIALVEGNGKAGHLFLPLGMIENQSSIEMNWHPFDLYSSIHHEVLEENKIIGSGGINLRDVAIESSHCHLRWNQLEGFLFLIWIKEGVPTFRWNDFFPFDISQQIFVDNELKK